MEDLKAIFASNLIKLRVAAGMTQAGLAEKLNYSDKSVSKWERAESLPDAYVLKQLSEIFSVDVDQLLTSHDEWKSPAEKRRRKVVFDPLYTMYFFIACIWVICVLEFVLVWMLLGKIHWITLIAAVPISLVVSIIFSAIWLDKKAVFPLSEALLVSIVLTIYFIFLPFNFWQLFLTLVPASLLLYVAFRFYKRRGK